MKKAKLIICLVSTLILFQGCSAIKRFLPDRKSNDDISYELIENLSTAFSEGKLQALEEMIAIYNDTNQPYDVRMAAGVALAETQHPTALNALSEAVGEAAALDVTFMIGSIELLAQFRDDPRAADAMISAMNKVEEKTNELELSLVKNLNKVRTKDQVMALLDLYAVSRSNFNRTEKLLTETLGALGTDEVVPILTQISRDPFVNLGIAVASDSGLLVPVINEVDNLDIFELAEKISGLVELAREQKIKAQQMQGATFTVTNYGSLGGRWALPIISKGQAGILGVGKIEERPIVVEGKVEARPTMPIVLGADHRLIDGDVAEAFKNSVMNDLREPLNLLVT